jgi:hypothetical protein
MHKYHYNSKAMIQELDSVYFDLSTIGFEYLNMLMLKASAPCVVEFELYSQGHRGVSRLLCAQ